MLMRYDDSHDLPHLKSQCFLDFQEADPSVYDECFIIVLQDVAIPARSAPNHSQSHLTFPTLPAWGTDNTAY